MSRGDISGRRGAKVARVRTLELPIHEKANSAKAHPYGRFPRRRHSSLGNAASLLWPPPTPLSPFVGRRRRQRFWKSPRTCAFALLRLAWFAALILGCTAVLTAILFPSYTRLPLHYRQLYDSATQTEEPGRANPNNERVFIAASLYDPKGDLVHGLWGGLVKELVDLLGPENTFLSIFESDSGEAGHQALEEYGKGFPCQHKFTDVDEVELEHPALITLPDGATSVKRIEYLAEARNRALAPIRGLGAPRYDKILFLNDVVFDPIEAAQLLFSTNIQPNGRTGYKAACAQDFKSPFLMYDMLATRDADGRQLGVPLFPWFSTSGSGKSRQDVTQQADAVEVKSCWGGMVAFDASFFQDQRDQGSPVSFRAEQDLFHEYSECCLIHADLIEKPKTSGSVHDTSTQIFMNPYVRTAYEQSTFDWLWLGRRLERMLPVLQRIITYYAGLPFFNARREVRLGDPLAQILYHRDGPSSTGRWKAETAPANAGSYCAVANLMIKRLDRDKRVSNWETVGPDDRDSILREYVDT